MSEILSVKSCERVRVVVLDVIDNILLDEFLQLVENASNMVWEGENIRRLMSRQRDNSGVEVYFERKLPHHIDVCDSVNSTKFGCSIEFQSSVVPDRSKGLASRITVFVDLNNPEIIAVINQSIGRENQLETQAFYRVTYGSSHQSK